MNAITKERMLEWLDNADSGYPGDDDNCGVRLAIRALIESAPDAKSDGEPASIPYSISPEEGKKIMVRVNKFCEEKSAPVSGLSIRSDIKEKQ